MTIPIRGRICRTFCTRRRREREQWKKLFKHCKTSKALSLLCSQCSCAKSHTTSARRWAIIKESKSHPSTRRRSKISFKDIIAACTTYRWSCSMVSGKIMKSCPVFLLMTATNPETEGSRCWILWISWLGSECRNTRNMTSLFLYSWRKD